LPWIISTPDLVPLRPTAAAIIEAPMKSKFAIAMSIYGILALIASFLLHGEFRWGVLILLGGLAVKTWIARAAGW